MARTLQGGDLPPCRPRARLSSASSAARSTTWRRRFRKPRRAREPERRARAADVGAGGPAGAAARSERRAASQRASSSARATTSRARRAESRPFTRSPSSSQARRTGARSDASRCTRSATRPTPTPALSTSGTGTADRRSASQSRSRARTRRAPLSSRVRVSPAVLSTNARLVTASYGKRRCGFPASRARSPFGTTQRPIVHGGLPLGVALLARAADRPFDPETQAVIRHLADQAAGAARTCSRTRGATARAHQQRGARGGRPTRSSSSTSTAASSSRTPAKLRLVDEVLPYGSGETIWEQGRGVAPHTTDPEAYIAALDAIAANPERESVDLYRSRTAAGFNAAPRPCATARASSIGRLLVLREVPRIARPSGWRASDARCSRRRVNGILLVSTAARWRSSTTRTRSSSTTCSAPGRRRDGLGARGRIRRLRARSRRVFSGRFVGSSTTPTTAARTSSSSCPDAE